MRKLLATIIFATVVFSLVPIPLHGELGLYNSWSGIIWCKPAACTHEQGHRLDDMSGWVSKTDDFHEVVNEMGLNLWDNYQEDYAQIYDLADGCKDKMPIELQDFYDWNLAKRLIN